MPEIQATHKFWMLSAIGDILEEAVDKRLDEESTPVDVLKCSQMFLDLLRSNGSKVLT